MSVEILLRRLTDQRGWNALTTADGRAEPEAVRRLASALGWHAADLFAAVGQELPADLLITDPQADASTLAVDFIALPPARPFLLASARRMPQQAATGPQPPPLRPFPADKAGAVIGRILHSRNFRSAAAAELLLAVGGPLLAASTVNRILLGDKALTPQAVGGFALFLGIPVGDLAALCDVLMTEDVRAPEYAEALAEFLWEERRLTRQQIQELAALSHELRHRFAAGLDEGARCGCGFSGHHTSG